jgi:hypothetical protein
MVPQPIVREKIRVLAMPKILPFMTSLLDSWDENTRSSDSGNPPSMTMDIDKKKSTKMDKKIITFIFSREGRL